MHQSVFDCHIKRELQQSKYRDGKKCRTVNQTRTPFVRLQPNCEQNCGTKRQHRGGQGEEQQKETQREFSW